tara:strand:- start:712 stop:1113 length:402 start_codon:yes stop_codon:yes gene_type:complete
MSIAHIGDSRIYHLKINEAGEKALMQITNDDTRVATLLKDGKISEYEARNHPMKNMLTRALGANNQFVDPEIQELDVQKGEKIFICSDGVTDGIWNSEIKELLEKESTAKEIVNYAVRVSGKDNATAIVVTID